MTTRLRIARIVSDREVAITGGKDSDIKPGDILLILGRPIQIEDPDTGESLGEIVTNKAVVRVYDVQDRFCLARTFRQRKVNVGGSGMGGSGLAKFFEPPKYETRTETLQRNPQAGMTIEEDDAIVQVGDAVEKFEGNVEDIPTSSVWR